jgi:hypothetical protein
LALRRICLASSVPVPKFVQRSVIPTRQYWSKSRRGKGSTVRSRTSTSCPASLKQAASKAIPRGGTVFLSKARGNTRSTLPEILMIRHLLLRPFLRQATYKTEPTPHFECESAAIQNSNQRVLERPAHIGACWSVWRRAAPCSGFKEREWRNSLEDQRASLRADNPGAARGERRVRWRSQGLVSPAGSGGHCASFAFWPRPVRGSGGTVDRAR